MGYEIPIWRLVFVAGSESREKELIRYLKGKQSRNSSLYHTVSRYIARPIREYLSEYSKSK